MTITIVQEEEDKVIIVGDVAAVPATGATVEVDVQYNVDYTVEVEESAQSWIHYLETRVVQSGKLVFKVDANDGDKRSGKVTIKDNAGKVDSVTITIVQEKKIEVESVTLDRDSAEIVAGESLQLTATVAPEDAMDKTVTWSSDNETVATVDENGLVTGVAEGTATITAKAGEKTATCQVAVTPDLEAEAKAILMEFYRAMDGPNWKMQGNWGTTEDLNTWWGVTFEKKNGVTSLYFQNVGLKGEIPECIGELTGLTEFHLENDPGVTGTLPDSFRKLVNLQTVFIRGTEMTSLPDVWADMTQLKSVNIFGNTEMTGPLPESLGRLPSLDFLSITSNRISGTVPESWGEWCFKSNLFDNCLTGKVSSFCRTAEEVKTFVFNGNLWQKDGYGFDISDVEIPGGADWPENKTGGQKTLTDYNGDSFTFEDVISKNRYTAYISWSTWDPFSRHLMPRIKQLYEECHQNGFEVIATVQLDENGNPWQDDSALRQIVKERGYDAWHNFTWGPWGYSMSVPVAEVYDSNGNIVFSSFHPYPDPVRNRFGRSTGFDLAPFLESVLEPVKYTSTDYSKDGEVMTLQTATAGNGINVVFMGDAYTDKDMGSGGRYEEVMKQSMEELFKIEPYKSFRNRFNVYAVKVVSPNGKVGGGYTTALETSFGYGSEIYCNTEKSEGYALKVPSITSTENLLTFVMVNDPDYKGMALMSRSALSGIAFITTEGNDPYWFGNTIRHESGHAFGFLADEYVSYEGLIPANKVEEYTDLYNQFGWYSNVDFTNDPSKVHWSFFLSDDRYKNETGIYEGGFYYEKGVFRPSENSMMRDQLEYFNAPSRLAIYKRIMELSGEEYSFEKFLEYDAVNRGAVAAAAARPPLKAPAAPQRNAKHTAPPKIVP